jgi:hypothetical protein
MVYVCRDSYLDSEPRSAGYDRHDDGLGGLDRDLGAASLESKSRTSGMPQIRPAMLWCMPTSLRAKLCCQGMCLSSMCR